ncbi:MAG: transcription elongation factor GreA [Rhizobiales bacterium]|nr:transcription elongation factor GreA [Hyphomicrobiales bacterium]
MSRAFVKESDGAGEALPERPISPHPNYVTPAGMAGIEAETVRLQREMAAAAGDRDATARIGRDLRYWQARRASAELIPAPADNAEVRFGSRVTLRDASGRVRTFRIVGEDEADPGAGTISYVAPLARALAGKAVGDEVTVPGGTAEIVAID